jgi:hypothetical protein
MHVFSSSQQKFKQQLDTNSQASTVSVSPSPLTPSPTKMLTSPLPLKKRTVDMMLGTSSLMSPSISPTSSDLVSPESHGGQGHNALHGSETDEASECPLEVVQERMILNLRPRRNLMRKSKKPKVQPEPLIKLQQTANHFQKRSAHSGKLE